jgi:hypothetical protein
MQTTTHAYEKAAQSAYIRLRYADVAKHVVWPMMTNNNIQAEVAAVRARFVQHNTHVHNMQHDQQLVQHHKKVTRNSACVYTLLHQF